MSKSEDVGEFGLIAWIREQSQRVTARVEMGIGDDCAILRIDQGSQALVTTDMLMDGRHFRLGEATAWEVGTKAMAVNLSDIAAMAGVPVAAFVAVALPRSAAVEVAQSLHEGLVAMADRFGVSLAGGDTNAWDGPLVVCVTVVGETTGRGAVVRSGAKAGDSILVTGPLGGSLLGRHLRPTPRIIEALALARAVAIHAMIDISDGLASDLMHILEESGHLGATLDAALIPIHDDAHAMARISNRPALDHALHDGEDFELCLTLDANDAAKLLAAPPAGVQLWRVGTIEAEPGLRLKGGDGVILPLLAKGFDHLAKESTP